MAKMNNLLTQRLKMATEKLSKMTDLAELSSAGGLSSFSGVFRVTDLNDKEKEVIETILNQHNTDELDTHTDLESLVSISSEVKAINNQAAILHGERIKRAQNILKKYADGAFTAWLIALYGNRQTPYNFLQYYEFYTALPGHLHTQLEEMPRQVVYALASRSGPLEDKQAIVKSYHGQTKEELISLIRDRFPLPEKDKRAHDIAACSISTLKKLNNQINHPHFIPSTKQKETILKLLDTLRIKTQNA